MFKAVIVAVALAVATPAAADWRHDLSGISVPDSVGDMRKGVERRVVEDGSDIFVQYGTDAEPVTLYVYRASHPNPALWFDRTLAAMVTNVGQPAGPAAPRPFTLGQASAPNGLRTEFAVTGKAWTSTAFAMAQHGEWLVKARVTSSTLDPAGAAKRLDALLAAIMFAQPASVAPYPLTAPAACSGKARYRGKPGGKAEVAMAASIATVAAHSEAHGGPTGLAAEPKLWCREDAGELAGAISVFRRLDDSAWTALLGDAGMSASAQMLPKLAGVPGAALYANRTGPAYLIAVYDALPAWREAAMAAVPVLTGRAQPLATMDAKPR